MPTEIERLYREHRAGLVRLVERQLHDHHEAEDVVQTAFLDAQRALERGTVPHNPGAWLAAIALNAAYRLRRRRLKAGPLEEYAVQEASGMSEIRAALTSLPAEQRAAVLYRDVLGFSYGETAEQMGRSVNAVTMLLHRGRKRLRETLGVSTGGVGLWRWFKQAGAPQVAVVKGAAVVVAAAGLATGGVVAAGSAARVTSSIRTEPTTALEMRSGNSKLGAVRTHSGPPTHDSDRQGRTSADSTVAAVATSTQGSAADSTVVATVHSSGASPVSHSLPVPKVPITVAATATIATPITTVTVATPTSTTATVTTPITTVTIPIP